MTQNHLPNRATPRNRAGSPRRPVQPWRSQPRAAHPAPSRVPPTPPIPSEPEWVPPTPQPTAASRPLPPPVVTIPAPSRKPTKPAPPPKPPSPFRFLWSWQLWVILSLSAIVGAGGLGAALLFKLPAIPNCPSIFWPTASASLRIYCAQLAANKQTVDDLLEAIELVNGLPNDHPMRTEVDRYIETWASEILNLASETFHRGDLEGAIAIAQRIPDGTAARDLVVERVARWREIWDEGEDIYNRAEDALLNEDLRLAFTLTTQLLDVPNRYWQTTKYEELGDLITAAREDGNRLAQIRRLARRGGVDDLLQAIAMAQEIGRLSPAYPAAQRLIASLGRDMLSLAEAALDRENLAEALSIVEQVPSVDELQPEIQDFRVLAQARAQAWQGGGADLEAAIGQAQRIRRDRPLYGTAQRWIGRWQLEIRDVLQLNQARRLANLGSLPDLRAAIAEAQQIPASNPRGDEARALIEQWTTRIETTEDRPILDQAIALARTGDLPSAIAIAQQIESGRALYDDAQSRIQGWVEQIQRDEDLPILNEARRLAAMGNLRQAIATADQIAAGRVLHADAQADAQRWRTQIQSRITLQEAQQAAASGTPAALLEAIRTASQIPANSDVAAEADRLIAQWSQAVLQSAQVLADYDVESAIALLEQLPPHPLTAAAQQQQLETWQQLQRLPLQPAPTPSTEAEAALSAIDDSNENKN